MEEKLKTTQHCDDKLRTTLHCDDKDKLRRKLAQLQREYHRTVQRLKRAERSEAVKKHVRSRITEQNLQLQNEPSVTSPTPCPNSISNKSISSHLLDTRSTPGQGQATGPVECDELRRSPVVSFLDPSEASCPLTPGTAPSSSQALRPSSALRLRSRRSRLRWQKRWRGGTEVGCSTDNSEEGLELSRNAEENGKAEEEEKKKTTTTTMMYESQEFTPAISDSPSLLLSHWSTAVHSGASSGASQGTEKEGGNHHKPQSPTCWSPASNTQGLEPTHTGGGGLEPTHTGGGGLEPTHTDGGGLEPTHTGGGGLEPTHTGGGGLEPTHTDGGGLEPTHTGGGGLEPTHTGGGAFTDCIDEHTGQCTEVMLQQVNSGNTADVSGVTNEGVSEVNDGELGREGQLLSSCTLVDGLLFPAEYYVRTTRRMTSSRSQPNMQAVIRSQLSGGRQRRGRGRGGSRRAHANTYSSHSSQENALSSAQCCSLGQTHNTLVGQAQEKALIGQSQEKALIGQTHNTLIGQAQEKDLIGQTHNTPIGQAQEKALIGQSQEKALIGQAQEKALIGQSREKALIGQSPEKALIGQSPEKALIGQPSSETMSEQESGGSVPPAGPAGGSSRRRRRRGRGRRGTTLRCERSLRLEGHTGLAVVSDPCLPGVDRAEPALLPVEPALGHHSASPSPTSVVLSTSEVGRPRADEVYPIFKVSAAGTVKPKSNDVSWRSLLLATTPSPTTPLLLPVAMPTLCQVLKGLAAFDFQQDFHLPDDQFASLKLHKLRQAVTAPASYFTRSNSVRLASALADGAALRLPLPLTPTPTLSASDAQAPHLRDSSPCPARHSEARPASPRPTEVPLARHPGEGRADGACAVARDDVNLGGQNTDGAAFTPLRQRPLMEEPSRSPEQQNDPPGESRSPADNITIADHNKEDLTVNKSLLDSICPPEETSIRPAVQTCEDCGVQVEPSDKQLNMDSPGERSGTKLPTPPEYPPQPGTFSQLLLSPTLASPPCLHGAPHLLSSSPALPSLGLTPRTLTLRPTVTSPPRTPSLSSPPTLSPCPSVAPLPPNPPPTSTSSNQLTASSGPPGSANQTASIPGFQTRRQTVATADHNITKKEATEDIAEECPVQRVSTLKVPAGGSLVDACCVSGPSGELCVVAAGKWAVCVWDQTLTSGWGLLHTWTFDEPVINVFPVADAPGMLCVTLGQLEIREVWTLSCTSFSQAPLCKGVVQAVVGVAKSRVVSSSHSATVSTLQLFTVLGHSSAPASRSLACPGVCIRALAAVDGLSDALLGSTEGGLLFVWNLRTAQLLQRISLGEGLMNTSCLRGYSSSGVLFVLLQHQLLSTLEGEPEDRKGGTFPEEDHEQEKKTTALFSLVAVNPLTVKSALATHLYQPEAWSGRLCDADVHGFSVVGLSQRGCVFVWELGGKGASRVPWAPDSEGWQLARWGGRGTLLTGHHSGDLTLYRYTVNQS